MRKLVIVAIELLIPSLGFGMGFSIPKASILNTKPAVPKEPVTMCVDFSGVWKGSCVEMVNEGERTEREDSFTLAQTSCMSIFIRESVLRIGGFRAESEVGEGSNYNVLVYPYWNASKEILKAKVYGSGREREGKPISAIYKLEGKYKMELNKEGKLVISSSYKYSGVILPDETEVETRYTSSCIYTNQ